MEWTDDALGSIPGCSEVKLVDYAEAGYYAERDQGEIWIRGENVMGGYYDDPEQTAEAVTPDGWFKTGDIGMWDKNGHLKLIDRKKNLVKMRNGEYIAIEKVRVTSLLLPCPIHTRRCDAMQCNAMPALTRFPLPPFSHQPIRASR